VNAAEAFFDARERNVFIATAPATEVLDALERGLEHALPLVLFTGAEGVGKSAVLREFVARWHDRVHAARLDASQEPAPTLFAAAVRAFGGHVRTDDQRPEQVGRLAHVLAGIREQGLAPVLCVEDAHLLSDEGLLELGRIESAASAADTPLKLVLVGRPELLERLEGDALQALAAHIGERITLDAMALDDTRDYLAQRFGAATGGEPVFSKKSAREVHAASGGLPALVNALADEAQRCANAAGSSQVGPEHVRAVIAAAVRADAPEPQPVEDEDADDVDDEGDDDEDDAPADDTPEEADRVAGPTAPTVEPTGGASERRTAIPEKPKVIAAHAPPPTPSKAAAHLPPPAGRRPSLPVPPAPELDSGHPRVRDWVSRFTDGQPPIRFGGRAPLPASEPSELFPQDVAPADPPRASGPPPRQAKQEKGAAEPEAKQVAEPKAGAAGKDVKPKPVDSEPQTGPKPAPPEPATPVQTGSDAPPAAPVMDDTHDETPRPEPAPVAEEVTPEQLAPPPLVLDEAPAPATPEPAAPVVETTAWLEPPAVTTPATPPAPPVATPEPTATPTELTGQEVRPVSRKKQRAAQRKADRAARRASQAATHETSRAGTAAHEAGRTPEPSPTTSADAGPGPDAQSPPAAPERESRRRSDATGGTRPRRSAAPAAPAADAPPREERRTPVFERVLAALIPIVLMVGMAVAAVMLGRRGAFDRPVATETATPTSLSAAPPTEPTLSAAASATTDSLPEAASVQPSEPPDTIVAPEPEPEPDAVPDLSSARYCLAVGTYLFEDRAREKARTLTRRTHQQTWIESTTTGGTRAWRILLGAYDTEAAAERAADRLLGRGLVNEALVENLPADRR